MLTHEDGSYVLQWVQRTPESFAASGQIDLLNAQELEPKLEEAQIEVTPSPKAVQMATKTFRVLFNGPLITQTVGTLQQALERALNDPEFRDLQLVMSSSEGQHDAGFNLYGLLRSLPVPVHVHASGVVSQIGVFAFPGGHRRTCSASATFEFHPFAWGFGTPATIPQMHFAIERLSRNSELAKEIMRRHTSVSSDELENLFGLTPIVLSSSQAAAMGIVHDIVELNSAGERQETVHAISVNWSPR
jgi:ATP-dependent protease ClpP protease subunit